MLQAIGDFLYTYFHTYDITTEVVMLFVLIVMLVWIMFSKPERSYLFSICVLGIHFSIATILLHIWLLGYGLVLPQTNNFMLFYVVYVLYGACYVTVMNLLFSYISLLSYKRRSQGKYVRMMIAIFSTICAVILLSPMIEGRLIELVNGHYVFTAESNCYIYCSVLYAIVCFLASVANRNDVSRVVQWGCMMFIPMIFIAVLSQFYFPTAYFICATYTIPYMILYLIFHAFRFDEVVGCQNYDAESSMLHKYISTKKKFIFFSVSFPGLEKRDLSEIGPLMSYVGNSICRQVEKISPSARIYKVSEIHYQMICPVKTEDEFEDVKNAVLRILYTPVTVRGVSYKTPTNILIAENFEMIEDEKEFASLVKRMRRRFANQKKDEVILVTKEDVEKYKKSAMIEKNLLEIKNSNKLDDDRVLVFVQPIYNIHREAFMTGEALMRMKIDGKMIFPDEFIPVAEDIECIHALTRVMLHKVSKIVAEKSLQHEFDAITVNVSTMELNEEKAGEEFLKIITDAGANPEKIRIEITESTSITNYDTIIDNIKRMKDKGLRFYLDDFGTGYSNIDRIVTIPFTTIKFDKSLLYRALEDKKSEELFLLLLKFFKNNGFQTVIEGVEDDVQRAYVTEHGFDYIQGYVFSKPLPIVDVWDNFFVKKGLND